MLDSNNNEIVTEQSIDKVIVNGYSIFGEYVNLNRQIPSLDDGLKPVFRRLIQTAFEFPDRMTKTATVCYECFTGDTEVLDINNKRIRFDELSKLDLNSNPVYTFSVNSNGIPEVSRIIKAWSNGFKDKLVKVTLDNGEHFISTLDHKVLMRDGTYKECGKLNINDSLMPVNIIEVDDDHVSSGKRRVILYNNELSLVYKLAENHKDCIKDFTEGAKTNTHHIDFNSLNDYPNNLKIINEADHRALHGTAQYEIKWNSLINLFPEFCNEYNYIHCDDAISLNHKVTQIEFINESREVFDLEVDNELHNFTLACGVVQHNCMSKLHPHGDSITDVAPQLVNMGMFEGQGSFGNHSLKDEDLAPAAPRYTECKLNSTIRKQLEKLAPYIETKDAYSYGNKEWLSIPTPIPIMLTSGTAGLGFGVSVRLPAFTVDSLLEAYYKNDPLLLKCNYGYTLTDHNGILSENNKEGLRNLWNTGSGTLKLYIPIRWYTSDDGNYGVLFECKDPALFKPAWNKFLEWEDCGWVNIVDMSDKVSKIFIYRTARTRAITDEDVWNLAEDISKQNKGYFVTTSTNKTVQYTPIRDWISKTLSNYIKLYKRYQSDNIKILESSWVMWRDFHRVAELILEESRGKPKYELSQIVDIVNKENCNGKDAKFISEYKPLTEDHVVAIGRKSINTLRTTSGKEQLQDIENKIKEFKNLDINKEIRDYVNAWSRISLRK